MTIVFKTLKVKHQQAAKELRAAKNGADSERDANVFILSLVKEWDFIDDETGVLLPLNGDAASTILEMSIEQYVTMMREFNSAMEAATAQLPKMNAAPSRSGSTRSKKTEKALNTHQNG